METTRQENMSKGPNIKVLIFDSETTTFEHGSPFSQQNQLVSIGWKCLWKTGEGVQVRYVSGLYEDFLDDLNECTDIVGFNLKFDLHWLRRLGITAFQTKRMWDCQLAEYVLSDQKWVYPDLNMSLQNRGGPLKLDVVKTEYWDKGVDTDKIPHDILTAYLIQDVESTEWLYHEQTKVFQSRARNLFRIFRLTCDDMLVLEEMEANGLKLNVDLCHRRAKETHNKIQQIESKLYQFSNNGIVNWDSNDHLSAVLFGGWIGVDVEVSVGFFKTGLKAGLPKTKKIQENHYFDKLYDPDPDWEVKKTKDITNHELQEAGKFRMYFTNDEVLSLLKGKKDSIVELLKARARWVKILEYYTKLPEQISYMQWRDDKLHGQFNQVVTKTGRSSSSKPNMQNMAGIIQDILISRF